MNRRLTRDTKNAVLGGVAAGFANYFGVDPVLARIVFIALAFLNGFGVVAYVVGLGLLFQLPLLLVFWNWINPIPPGGLWNSQRFVIIGAFVAAAIITPTPDVLNQSMVALPIIAIYQLGAVAVFVSNRRTRRKQQKKGVAAPVTTSVLPVASQTAAPVAPAAPAVTKPVRPPQRPLMVDGFRPVRRVVERPLPKVQRPRPTRPSIDGLSRLPR